MLWLQITGGEALIDREFGAAYEYAHQLGMMVQVSSNGSSLRKRPIRNLFARHRPYRLTLSVYGASAGTYDKVTRNRGAFGRFIQGLDAAHQDRLPVRLNVIVSDDNAHEVDAMVALCERYSFPHQVFTNMSPTIDGEANPLATQAKGHIKARSVFTGCNAGRTFFHVNPHGIASVCKVGRDPSVNLVTEGVTALTRLGAIAESLQLRTGGCRGPAPERFPGTGRPSAPPAPAMTSPSPPASTAAPGPFRPAAPSAPGSSTSRTPPRTPAKPLTRDYLPEFAAVLTEFPSLAGMADAIGARVEPVPIPWDCADGLFEAYWRRPGAYLEDHVRRAMSVWTRVGPEAEQRAVRSLSDDLEDGRWAERNSDLADLDAADLGLRLLIA
ncbi:hypothetical protein ACWEPR_35915 [Streptomyces sp. NPDC004290]